jgi:YVTN family beta-propeller protein
MMSRYHRSSMSAAATIAAALVVLGSAAPVGAHVAHGGLGVRPAHGNASYITATLTPGARHTTAIVATNAGDKPLQLVVYAVDGRTSPTSGTVYSTREDLSRGAGRWLKTPTKTVTVRPGHRLTIPFTIRVPTGAAPGDHVAGIAVQQPSPRKSAGRLSVRSVFRQVVGVLIRVPGDASFQPQLTSGRLARIPGTTSAALRLGLANAGLRLGKPLLQVTMTGTNGYRDTVTRRLDTILPGDAIDYELPWPSGLRAGTYDVVARLSSGGTSPTSSTLHAKLRLATGVTGPRQVADYEHVSFAHRAPIAWWAIAIAALLAAIGFLTTVALRLWASGIPVASPSRRTRTLGLVAVATLAFSSMLFGAAESHAAGSLTNVAVSLSNGVASATNVTYTFSFTTASGQNLSGVSMTLPSGTGGAPSLTSVSGLPAGGTFTVTGTTAKYSFPNAYVANNVNVTIVVGAVTNTPTLGSYTSTISTIGASYNGYPIVDAGTSGAFAISGGTLTNTGWTLSQSAKGASSTAYTFTFTTATAATLDSVAMTVPSGTAGTPGVGSVSGVPSGGTVSLASNTLTYSFSGTSVPANTPISVQITGLTNTTTPGSYTSQLTTLASGTVVDAATTPSISITGGSLGSPSWSVSASAAGATDVAYTYSFTIGSTGSISSLQMTVPTETGGSPSIGSITSTYNSLPTNGTVTLSGTTLTYAFASTYQAAGYTVTIEVDHLTNTTSSGSYSSQLTTFNSGAPVDSGVTAAIAITGGALTSPIWSVSNTASGATGTTYTYSFTTSTAASLSSVTMTVPPGTGGTPGVGSVSGLPSGGSVSLATNTLTYSFSATSVPSNTAVTIHITGLTNTSTTGSYTSQLTTVASGSPIDTGLTSAVSITGGTLASPIWSPSSSTSGATGVSYTYTFTTGSNTPVSSVTMSVPPGTSGTPTVTSVSGVPTGGTVTLASNTLTYSFTQQFVNAGTAVSLTFGGLTNTVSTGSYTSQIATKVGLTPVDTGVTSPVAISGGSLTNAGWAVSNSAAGATNVTYTYTFTTASSASLTSVTMTVPPGTAGTPGLGVVTGLPSSGTTSLASGTITFSFASTPVASGTAVTIPITGMTNTSTKGSYTSQIATSNGGPVDTGTSGAASITGTSLTNPLWSIDASGSGATGVTYTYSFTTASGASLTGFTMSVPAGTSGSPTVTSITSTNSSVPTNGTITLASNTLTYAFGTYINAGTAITITIGGMTNTLTPGSYTANIASKSSAGPVDSGVTAAIAITGGTLSSPIWTPSSYATGATNTAYSYTFTTASSSLLDSVTMTVPPGTAGTPNVTGATGVPSNGSVVLGSNTLTYTFASTQVNASTSVEIDLSGLTNTTSTGSYTSQLTTYHATSPVDAGVTATVSFGGGSLTSPTWRPSSYKAGAAASYTYTFKTGSGANVNNVTMTVPPGTGGSPTVTSVSGVPAGGTVALASNTLTYTFSSGWVGAGTSATLTFGGLTNTSSAGSYTAQIATKSVTTPVDTGTTPTIGIANGNPFVAYVANAGGASVSSLHAGSAIAGTTTSLGTAPQALAMSPDGTTAYVVDSSANTITAVTVATGAAGTPATLSGCSTPKAIALTPNGSKAYVACSGNARVVPVALPGLSVGTAISVGTTPSGVAVSPDGATAYAVASDNANLTPITVSSNTAGSAISLTGCTTPQGIAIVPSGATAYIACAGNAKVLPVSLPGGSLGSPISVGTSPGAIAATPDGRKVYVANSGSASVTPITVSDNSIGAAISVGSTPQGVAVAPDGSIAYVANGSAGTVSQIRLSDNSVTQTISVGSSPAGLAFVPDQAPAASLTVTPAAAGSATSFDASASTVAYGTIVSYAWVFGDGTTATTSTASTTHTYAVGCGYTATVTETDSAGTSTTQVFTGQQIVRNGASTAEVNSSFGVTRSLGFATAPGNISFDAALQGVTQAAAASLALDVGNGTSTTGWSISGTSTTFTTGGADPHELPTTSVTIQTSPSVACDGSASCTLASNGIAYPVVLPAGTTPPTSAKLFRAVEDSGVCDQTVTPWFTLAIPPTTYAGTYASTWTFTLSSGP